jgi:hypothetical protein
VAEEVEWKFTILLDVGDRQFLASIQIDNPSFGSPQLAWLPSIGGVGFYAVDFPRYPSVGTAHTLRSFLEAAITLVFDRRI